MHIYFLLFINLVIYSSIWAMPPIDGKKLNIELLQKQQHEIQTIAAANGDLLASWADDISPNNKNLGWRCSYSVSKDNGITWSKPRIYKNPDYSLSANPTVAADNLGTLYAVCMSVNADYSKGILELSISKDRGKSWSSWRKITSKDHNSIPDRPKIIAGEDGQLFLVFTQVQTNDTNNPIFLESSIHYMYSLDKGATWSAEQVISDKRSDPPTIFYGYQGSKIIRDAQNNLLVSFGGYANNSLYFTKSTDGKKFSLPVEINTADTPFGVPCTEMAVDSSGLKIVMTAHEGHGIGNIYKVASTDGGLTWTRLSRLSNSGTNVSVLFDAQDKLHFMWHEYDYSWMDIKYATSSDFGETFYFKTSLVQNGYSLRMDSESDEFSTMMGSFQSLILSPNHSIFAFWVDFREGFPQLFFSNWFD